MSAKQESRKFLIARDKNGIEWIIEESDPVYSELLWKKGCRQEVFEAWEIFPELRHREANSLLQEAAVLEQAWWDTGDYAFRKEWFDRLLGYERVINSLPIGEVEGLADRLEAELGKCNDFDRLSKLLALKGLLLEVIRKNKEGGKRK